jgi:hypothetical protein
MILEQRSDHCLARSLASPAYVFQHQPLIAAMVHHETVIGGASIGRNRSPLQLDSPFSPYQR